MTATNEDGELAAEGLWDSIRLADLGKDVSAGEIRPDPKVDALMQNLAERLESGQVTIEATAYVRALEKVADMYVGLDCVCCVQGRAHCQSCTSLNAALRTLAEVKRGAGK